MKEYPLTTEPYITRLKSRDTVVSDIGNVLIFENDYVFDLAKATGLRSNKARHIKKRFKIVIMKAIDTRIKECRNEIDID